MAERIVKTTRWFKLELEAPAYTYGDMNDEEIEALERRRFDTFEVMEFADAIEQIEVDVRVVTVAE